MAGGRSGHLPTKKRVSAEGEGQVDVCALPNPIRLFTLHTPDPLHEQHGAADSAGTGGTPGETGRAELGRWQSQLRQRESAARQLCNGAQNAGTTAEVLVTADKMQDEPRAALHLYSEMGKFNHGSYHLVCRAHNDRTDLRGETGGA